MAAIETATVLFTDQVGSTEWRAALGDDVADSLRRDHDAATRAAIEGAGGRVVKHTGDGIMGVFAAAAAGVQAAVDIQRATARSRRPRDPALELRIGISAGDVQREGDDVFGTPVVEAARLCAAAGPGEILVADVARVLVGSRGAFTFTAPRALALKGLPGPLTAHLVTWVADETDRVPLPAPLAVVHPTPMVGRDEPFGRMVEAYEATPRSGRRLVLVAGEPGVGKTRLVSELARRAHDRGAVVLLGRSDDAVPSPMRPFIELVRHALAHVAPGRLEALDTRHRSALDRLVATGGGTDEAVDPLVETHARHEALDALLAAVADGGPVLVVLDDLHWADAASVVALRNLASTPQDAPVLLVGTYRETDLDRRHPFAACLADLRREPEPPTRILLRGLDRDGTADLVAAWVGGDAPAPFVDAVFTETEGNPFFCQEVLRHLVETGALFRDEDGTWTSHRPIAQLGIPEGVRETVGRRLAQLDDSANELLAIGAVIGREFGIDLLAAVADRRLDDVVDALDPALAAGLIEETDRFGLLRFAHALVRSTLYDELPTTRRVRLHQRVAHALEAAHTDPADVIEELAHHFTEAAVAGEWHAAIRAHVLAAEVAEVRAAPVSIQAHLEAALELFTASGIADDAMELELLVRLEWTIAAGADPLAAMPTVRRAVDVAHRLGDPEALALAAAPLGNMFEFGASNVEILTVVDGLLAELPPGTSQARASMTGLRASIMSLTVTSRDEVDRARREAEVALTMAEEIAAQGPPAWPSKFAGTGRVPGAWGTHLPLIGLHNALWGRPDVARATAVADRLVAEGAAIGWERGMAMNRIRRAIGWWQLGDRAAVDADHAGIEASGLLDVFAYTRAFWLQQRAGVAIGDGHLDEARALLDELLAVVPDSPNFVLGYHAARWQMRVEQDRVDLDRLEPLAAAVPFAWMEALPGLVRAERGDLAGATAVLDRFRVRNDLGIPFNSGQASTLRVLSEITAHVGDADLAAALEPYVEPYRGQLFVAFTGTFGDGAADRTLGLLALTRGEHDAAVARLTAGLALEERFGARALAARTRVWLARALRARRADGDEARAVDELDRASAAADELGLAGVARLAATTRSAG